MIIGVISDTHGTLARGALAALATAELILHAGDIGAGGILEQLATIAPVLAVRGNSDAGTPLARGHPATRWIEQSGVRIMLTHILGRPADAAAGLPIEPARRPDIVIFGHTHRVCVEHIAGVLFLNPGAAGRPRFGGGLSVALVQIGHHPPAVTIVPLPSA
jgi:putative phosphoesterase